MDLYIVLKSGTTFSGLFSNIEDAKATIINNYKIAGPTVTFSPSNTTVGNKVMIATVSNGDSFVIRQIGPHRQAMGGLEGF